MTGQYAAGGSVAASFGNSRVVMKAASTSNSNSAVVWSDANAAFIARFSSTLGASPAESLAASGRGPDIASTGSDYAVAWATAEGFQYELLSSGGVPLCSPAITSVSFGDGVLGDSDAVAVASAGNGSVYVLVVDSDGVGLFRMAATAPYWSQPP